MNLQRRPLFRVSPNQTIKDLPWQVRNYRALIMAFPLSLPSRWYRGLVCGQVWTLASTYSVLRSTRQAGSQTRLRGRAPDRALVVNLHMGLHARRSCSRLAVRAAKPCKTTGSVAFPTRAVGALTSDGSPPLCSGRVESRASTRLSGSCSCASRSHVG